MMTSSIKFFVLAALLTTSPMAQTAYAAIDIQEAVLAKNAKAIIEQIKQGQNPNQEFIVDEYDSKEPLLFWAITEYNQELVNVLIEKGADLNVKNTAGESLLEVAVKQGNAKLFKLLLTKGLKVPAEKRGGFISDTLSSYASVSEKQEILSILLASGLPKDHDTQLNILVNALSESALKDQEKPDILKLLMQKGLNLKSFSMSEDIIPLLMISGTTSPEVFSFVLKHGGSVSPQDLSRFMLGALQTGQNEIALALLEAGADPNAASEDSGSPRYPLQIAAEYNDLKLFQVLMAKGAKITPQNFSDLLQAAILSGNAEIYQSIRSKGTLNIKQIPPLLELAANQGKESSFNSLLKELKSHGQKPDKSLLITAFKGGTLNIVKSLAQEFDLSQDPAFGKELLQAALKNKQSSILKFVLDNGVKADEKTLSHFLLQASKANNSDFPMTEDQGLLLLEAGADPNAFEEIDTEKGNKLKVSALSYAIDNGYNKLVRHLLERGAKISQHPNDLIRAAEVESMNAQHGKSLIMVKLLLEHGAEVNLQDEQGHTALLDSVLSLQNVRHLLAHGADPDLANTKQVTPLMAAAQNYLDPEIMGLLLSRGAKKDTQDINGNTALHYAADYGQFEKLKLLLSIGANPKLLNHKGQSVLMLATSSVCINSNRGVKEIEPLLQDGAKGFASDQNGLTVWEYALPFEYVEGINGRHKIQEPKDSMCHRTIRQLFLDRMTSTDMTQNKQIVFHEAQLGSSDLLKQLLAKGADPNAKDAQGQTALMMAIKRGKADMLEDLIQAGADLQSQAVNGWGVLHFAAESGQNDVMKLLLAKGANPNQTANNGWTPLMEAAERGSLAMVKDLLAKGAKVEAKSQNGDSAFLAAARSGQVDILKLLLAQGTDLSQADALGANALHQAAGAAKGDVIQFLLSKGLDPKLKDHQGRLAKAYVDQSNAPEIAELF